VLLLLLLVTVLERFCDACTGLLLRLVKRACTHFVEALLQLVVHCAVVAATVSSYSSKAKAVFVFSCCVVAIVLLSADDHWSEQQCSV
jgi:hypothetical protein